MVQKGSLNAVTSLSVLRRSRPGASLVLPTYGEVSIIESGFVIDEGKLVGDILDEDGLGNDHANVADTIDGDLMVALSGKRRGGVAMTLFSLFLRDFPEGSPFSNSLFLLFFPLPLTDLFCISYFCSNSPLPALPHPLCCTLLQDEVLLLFLILCSQLIFSQLNFPNIFLSSSSLPSSNSTN